MSYLKTIVRYINCVLEENLLSAECFANRKVIDIAQALPVHDRDEIAVIPSYVDHDGEARYVGPDDDYDLMLYHKVHQITAGRANLPAFGDARIVDAQIARMSIVVFGVRKNLRMANDELAIRIQASMPEAVTKQMLQDLQFKAANINVNDIVLNDMQVFSEEFQNAEFFLKPEQFLFKINYTIESAFLKECFNKCNCT